ncbi:hypothetical protein CB0940_01155 [Cercospora beticola]|uniref:Uncharacterized protein n=1 Tax=Cercospora beticola TaxID=122368 RepID=A0A2G5I9A2_CERBT|nr:hypothetical protein CB0940_01155 [Cercospora beticola]PIB01361.1 hypothetical protein CB0940_01155 [Cercospora beticola]
MLAAPAIYHHDDHDHRLLLVAAAHIHPRAHRSTFEVAAVRLLFAPATRAQWPPRGRMSFAGAHWSSASFTASHTSKLSTQKTRPMLKRQNTIARPS